MSSEKSVALYTNGDTFGSVKLMAPMVTQPDHVTFDERDVLQVQGAVECNIGMQLYAKVIKDE